MGRVLISDAALPAAAHLVGPDAIEVLRVPVEAAGGVIESLRACHVQYRPGSDATVRYTAHVAWQGQPAKRETLVAATTIHGTHPTAALVTADTPAGRLDVGVWRWPFDPVLSGLAAAVTPNSVAELIGSPDRTGLELDVVAYRPTERAVVRVRQADQSTIYLKVVAPHAAEQLADRHARLRRAGVAAPHVRHIDERGILVLDELAGSTFRDHIKADTGPWPEPTEFDQLADAFAATDLVAKPVSTKVTDGVLHASMLATVMPEHRGRLEELADHLQRLDPIPSTTTIHGDLHEGQLVIHDGLITGVLDIDDAGPGDPIDDRANLIAHLRYRAVTNPGLRRRLADHADLLREASLPRFDLDRLDTTTAAALVGLATGPFRIQQPGWRTSVDVLLLEAERIARSAPRAEPQRRGLSSAAHRPLTDVCT